jgi:hypothetical protein
MLDFSKASPNLVSMIPYMDQLDEYFTTIIQMTTGSKSKNPAICTAVRAAKVMLNQYYSLTDTYDLYHIAMSMSFDGFPADIVLIIMLSPSSKV